MPKPQLLAIGLTVYSAPVALREQLSIPEAEWPRAIAELTQYPHIEEAAVLSTCNRLELYAVLLSWHPGVREVEDWLCRTSGLPLEQLRPHLFLLREQDAAHHLLRVASGLDSLVLGEGQILAQVCNWMLWGARVCGVTAHSSWQGRTWFEPGLMARAAWASQVSILFRLWRPPILTVCLLLPHAAAGQAGAQSRAELTGLWAPAQWCASAVWVCLPASCALTSSLLSLAALAFPGSD